MTLQVETSRSVIEQPGAIDPAQMAWPQESVGKIDRISLRTITGFWYQLEATEETRLEPERNEITGLSLKAYSEITRQAAAYEVPFLAINAMKNWISEKRHLRSTDDVSAKNELIKRGGRLVINGRQSSPLDVAWVTYRPDYQAPMIREAFFGFPSV